MTYPYIGKGIESGSIVLIYGKDSAIVMDSKTWAAKDSEDTEVDESYFKNITAEYLANTYGEVKSKEHAEFIVRLRGGDSSSIGNLWSQSLKCFVIDSDGKVSFGSRVYYQEKVGKREITIPLPPECDGVDEFKFDNLNEANKAVNLLEERFQSLSNLQTETANLLQSLILEGVDVEAFNDILKDKDRSERFGAFIDWRNSVASKMKEINIKQKSSIDEAEADGIKMIERAKNNEWPKVGDEVQTNFGKGVVELLPDVKGCFVVQVNGGYLQLKRDELGEPKTPEQELRELLHLLWRENNEDFDDFADIAVLHLTKKGEGDE